MQKISHAKCESCVRSFLFLVIFAMTRFIETVLLLCTKDAFYFGRYVYSANDNHIRSMNRKSTYCHTKKYGILGIQIRAARMHRRNHNIRLHQLVPSLILSPPHALLLSTRAYSHLPLILFSYNWIQVRNERAFRLPVCCCCFC